MPLHTENVEELKDRLEEIIEEIRNVEDSLSEIEHRIYLECYDGDGNIDMLEVERNSVESELYSLERECTIIKRSIEYLQFKEIGASDVRS